MATDTIPSRESTGVRLAPWLVGAFVFAVRLVHLYFFRHNPLFDDPILDARFYEQWAGRLLAGAWFGSEIYQGNPLYAYVLALLQAALGSNTFAITVAQAVSSALSAVLITHLGSTVFSPLVGIVAGLAFGATSPAVLYDGVLVGTSLEIFLGLAVLAVAYRYRERGLHCCLFLGILTGLAILSRERQMLLVPLLALDLVLGQRRKVRRLAVFTLGLVPWIALPALNNWFAARDLLLFFSNGGINFYIGNEEGASGAFKSPADMRRSRDGMYEDACRVANQATGRDLKPSQVSRYWYRRALSELRQRPWRAAELLYLKLSKHLYGGEIWDVFMGEAAARYSPVLRYSPINFFVIGPLALLGLLWPRRCRARERLLLFYLLSQLVFVLVFFTSSRFRVPMLPVLLLFSAYGAVQLIRQAMQKPRSLLVSVPLLGAAVALVWAPTPDRTVEPSDWAIWHTNVGLSYMRRGEPEKALSELSEALRLNPQSQGAWLNYGRALDELGRLAEAAEACRRACELPPLTNPVPCMALGSVLIKLKRYSEVGAAFAQAVERDPANSEAQFQLGTFFFLHNELGRAEQHLRTAAQDPGRAAAAEAILRQIRGRRQQLRPR
ncbi:MAG: tetratricopeptide repeat protein [Planctomycetota bacterium]